MYAFGLKSGYILHQNGPLKRKDYGFQRQSDEKPSIIPGCPEKLDLCTYSSFLLYHALLSLT